VTASEPGSGALALLQRPSRLAEDLLVAAIAASADRFEGLMRREAFARSVEVGIDLEALMRRALEAERRLVWGACGLSLGADVGRLREQMAAAEAGGGPAGVRHSRRRPLVHWHETGRGPAVLLLNGWTASGLMWPDAFVTRLERRFRVIRPDNRGSGWSRSAPAPFSIGDMADDAAAILAATETPSAVVVGLSMGGMIAQELAIRHPQLVERLLVVASRPPAPVQLPPTSSRTLGTLLRRPAGMSAADYVRAMWSGFCAASFGETHPAVLDEIVAHVMRRPTPRHLMLQQARAVVAWSDPRRLARIAAPTIVVHGTADPLMPVGNGMRLARLIPGADYVEFAGVGHVVSFEAPDPLADLVEEWAAPARRAMGDGAHETHAARLASALGARGA
jgi:pimeloyl-ACP methyl ester carboxylesterase